MENNKSTQQQKGVVKNFNTPTNQNPKSKLDSLFGEHTTSVLVTFMFTLVLIGLILVVCSKEKLPDGFQTGLITLLGTLAGFFAGTKLKKG